jgi:hypothetical protein
MSEFNNLPNLPSVGAPDAFLEEEMDFTPPVVGQLNENPYATEKPIQEHLTLQ